MKPLTIASVRAVVQRFGGRLERDGCGGYEALAPDGLRWTDAEVWCYALPLSEAESPAERQEMLHQAVTMLSRGVR